MVAKQKSKPSSTAKKTAKKRVKNTSSKKVSKTVKVTPKKKVTLPKIENTEVKNTTYSLNNKVSEGVNKVLTEETPKKKQNWLIRLLNKLLRVTI